MNLAVTLALVIPSLVASLSLNSIGPSKHGHHKQQPSSQRPIEGIKETEAEGFSLVRKIAQMQADGADSSAISEKFVEELRPITMKGCLTPFLCAAPGPQRIKDDCKQRINKYKRKSSAMFDDLEAANAEKTAQILPLVNGLDQYLQLDLTQSALLTAFGALAAEPPDTQTATAAVGQLGMAMIASVMTTPDQSRLAFATAVKAMTANTDMTMEGDMKDMMVESCKKMGGDKYVETGWVEKRPETLEEHWCYVPDQCHDSLHKFYTDQCEKEKDKIENKINKCIKKTVNKALGAVPSGGHMLPNIDLTDASTQALFINMAVFKGIGEKMSPIFDQLEDGMHDCFEEHMRCGEMKALGQM